MVFSTLYFYENKAEKVAKEKSFNITIPKTHLISQKIKWALLYTTLCMQRDERVIFVFHTTITTLNSTVWEALDQMRKLDEENVWLVVRYTSVMYIKLLKKNTWA